MFHVTSVDMSITKPSFVQLYGPEYILSVWISPKWLIYVSSRMWNCNSIDQYSVTKERIAPPIYSALFLWDLREMHLSPSEARKKPRLQSQTFVVDDDVQQTWSHPPLFVVHGPTATTNNNVLWFPFSSSDYFG